MTAETTHSTEKPLKWYTKMTIKELRTAAGMTQQAFAEYLHIPKRNIENWETGVARPAEYLIELIEYKLKGEGLI